MTDKSVLIKIEKYMKMFINEKKSLNCSINTINTYIYVLDSFYNYIINNCSIDKITDINKEILLDFISYNKNSSNSTKILYLRIIKLFFNFIDEKEGLNSLFEIRFKKLSIKQEIKEVEALNSNEVKKLLNYIDNRKRKSFNKIRDALLIKLILFTGIRASEALNIVLNDFIEIKSNEVILYKIKIAGKGNKERFVYIKKDKIYNELEYLKNNGYIKDYIAVTKLGKKMTREGLYSVITTKMKQADINKKGVHILRHTFARDLVAKNINLQTISELLGHSSIVLTSKIYARSNEESKILAVSG